MEYLIPVVVVSILILTNGLFVAAEFAIAGASRPRLAYLAEEGSVTAQHVLDIVTNPQHVTEYLSTAQVGVTVASLGLGMYAEPTIAHWLYPALHAVGIHSDAIVHTLATLLTVGLLTYLHVVLGEMVPKSLSLQSTEKAAIYLYPFMAFSQKLFGFLTALLNGIGFWLLRVLNMPQQAEESNLVTSDDLSYIVEASLEGGFLHAEEQVYLENVIDFHERIVGQVMTPRNRMVALPADESLGALLDVMCSERYSRFPVYRESTDEILGVLHLKDVARAYEQGRDNESVQEIVRPPVFIPESLPLDEMLQQFRSSHTQIAIVVDEYGGTAGLITLEDLAEEIIGEIQDEFDEEIAPFVQIGPGSIRVRGDLLLDELEQHYDIDIDTADAETVGGLLMEELGRVPEVGDRLSINNIEIIVESVAGLAVNTAMITYTEKSDSE